MLWPPVMDESQLTDLNADLMFKSCIQFVTTVKHAQLNSNIVLINRLVLTPQRKSESLHLSG